jgi:putative PEP-CTERM system TPR-repeat lipoprotein
LKGRLARIKDGPAGELAAYQKILEISAENIHALVRITWLKISEGNLDEARKQLEQIRKIAPNYRLTKYLLALIEFRQKNYIAARDAVLQALKAAPNHLPSVLLAGTVEYTLGAHSQAQKHLALVVKQAPGHRYARKLLVASLAKTGQLQRAIEVLQPGLLQETDDFELTTLAGEVYLQGNEFSKAVQYFEKAMKLAPKSAHARTGLGVSRLVSGEPDRALADLESAVALDTGKSDILLVMSALQRANYDQALQAMQSLEEKQPKNPLTYHLKGMIYSGKKDETTARKHFEHALELSPMYVAAAMKLAQLDLQDKKPADARRRFEAMLEKDKNNTRALLALANIAPRVGATLKEQIDWLERARNASPSSSQPKLMLARAYMRSGDPTKALDIMQQAAAAHPNNPNVLDTLGAIQIGAGAKEQALATYNKVVELQPKSATALFRLAMAQAANADQTSAANTLRKAVSLQPDFIDAHIALAALELNAKRYPAAMKIAKQVQMQSAKSPAGFLIEGDIMMAEKKFPQAAKAYETAYGMGKNGVVLIKLHRAYIRAGKAEEAERRLAQWLKDSPDDATVRYYAAEVSLKLGKYKDAIEHYEWVLKKQPDNVSALNNLATAYSQVKDARASETAEHAYKLSPNNAAVADTLGWILVEQGDTKRGLELLQKAVTAAPKATEPRYHLARALMKVGDRAKAREELEKLLADAPGSRFANDAKQLLSDLSQ